jgi:hypothetical protein
MFFRPSCCIIVPASQSPVKRRATYVEAGRHVFGAVACGDKLPRLLDVSGAQLRFAAKLYPSLAGCRHTGTGALSNKPALELGQRPEDVKDETPARRGRIDFLGK